MKTKIQQKKKKRLSFIFCCFQSKKFLNIVGMNNHTNECSIFPVQQIMSTSLGAMCTALFMVEDILFLFSNKRKKKDENAIFRHHLMLFEYDCNHKVINQLKEIVMYFIMDSEIIFVHVLMEILQFHGTIDQYREDIMAQLMHYSKYVYYNQKNSYTFVLLIHLDNTQ